MHVHIASLGVFLILCLATDDPIFNRIIFGLKAAESSTNSRIHEPPKEEVAPVNVESSDSDLNTHSVAALVVPSTQNPAQQTQSYVDGNLHQSCVTEHDTVLNPSLMETLVPNTTCDGEKSHPAFEHLSPLRPTPLQQDASNANDGRGLACFTNDMNSWPESLDIHCQSLGILPDANDDIFDVSWVTKPSLADLFRVTDERVAIIRRGRPIDMTIEVEDATVIYLANRFGLPQAQLARIGSKQGHPAQIKAIKKMLAQNVMKPGFMEILDNAATVSTRTLCRLSLLESYIYGVGGE